jgi:glycosyltransferase involved in cell wall biosynthesis
LSVSIIIPAYEEGDSLRRTICGIYTSGISFNFEVIVVVDSESDSSTGIVRDLMNSFSNLKLLVQNDRGPLNAIRCGIQNSYLEFIVVITADDTDDVSDISRMNDCFMDGAHYVTASRYIHGGSYAGGPRLKRLFSKIASRLLELRHGSIASDPTNGFKGFSRHLYSETKIKGDAGFTYGLQLLRFALSCNFQMAVIPTKWHDRVEGASSFKILKWMPSYTTWFLRVIFTRSSI